MSIFRRFLKYVLGVQPLELVHSTRCDWLDKLSNCSSFFPTSIKDYYIPTWWLYSGHLQTLFVARLTAPEIKIDYTRELLRTPDGGTLALDWYPAVTEATKRILVILHGLAGGSDEAYVRVVVDDFVTQPEEEAVVVVNFRGCGNSPLTSPQLYCGAFTEDIRLAAREIKNRYPHAKLGLIGFSLGANVVVKYLGEEEANSPFDCAASIANPFDMLYSSRTVDRTFIGRYIYSPQLAKGLLKLVKKHYEMLSKHPLLDLPYILQSRTVREIDSRATSVAFGYETADHYYREASSARFVTKVRIPLFCLNAEDDFLCPRDGIPFDEVRRNPYVLLGLTKKGGHIGWFEGIRGKKQWFVKPVIQYFKTMLA